MECGHQKLNHILIITWLVQTVNLDTQQDEGYDSLDEEIVQWQTNEQIKQQVKQNKYPTIKRMNERMKLMSEASVLYKVILTIESKTKNTDCTKTDRVLKYLFLRNERKEKIHEKIIK